MSGKREPERMRVTRPNDDRTGQTGAVRDWVEFVGLTERRYLLLFDDGERATFAASELQPAGAPA